MSRPPTYQAGTNPAPEQSIGTTNSASFTTSAIEACPSAHPDDVGDRLAITQARILAKLAALGDVAADDDEGPDPEQPTQSERGDSEQINELELRNESGASQREEARDRDTTGAVPDGQSNW